MPAILSTTAFVHRRAATALLSNLATRQNDDPNQNKPDPAKPITGPGPAVVLTPGNFITVISVLLFGIGLGGFIWWYCRPAAVTARNKRKGVA